MLNATILENTKSFNIGDSHTFVLLHHFTKVDEYGKIKDIFMLENTAGKQLEVSSKLNKTIKFNYNNIKDFWDATIVSNCLSFITKNGTQDDLRSEMEQDAFDYIQKVQEHQLSLNDPYLESYIYSLVSKITPSLFTSGLIDGRTGNVNILIIQDPQVNACCYPNGTIVLNTGLLSKIHTEDELVAILAHEIAHYVLDHSIQNVIKAEIRQKRAEFWSMVATGIAAVAETAIAASNEYYNPGAVTLGVAMMSSVIASQVIDRLGMEYNHEQENEADALSREILTMLGYNASALGSVFSRIKEEYLLEKNNALYFNSYTHPAIEERIKANGQILMAPSKKFEQIMSFAVTNTAIIKYNHRRFDVCNTLVSRNIQNNVGTADDYILKAYCILATENTENSNNEVLELARSAQLLDPNNINGYKVEIITQIRLNNYTEAQLLLKKYLELFNNVKMCDKSMFIEQDWAKKMAIKVKGLSNNQD